MLRRRGIGIFPANLCRIEQGKDDPSWTTIWTVADLLDLDAADLVSYDENGHRNGRKKAAQDMKLNFILAGLIFIGAADWEAAFKAIDKEITEADSRWLTSVSADDLYTSYDHNAVRADRQFKNKIIVITGKVKKISRHPVNNLAMVTFAPEEKTQYDLNCYFSKNFERDAASLYAGQSPVHLYGKVAGSNSLEIAVLGCRIHR